MACGSSDSNSIFASGEKLRVAGKYREAIEKYKEVTLYHSKSSAAPDALFRIGEISSLHLKEFEEAVTAFKELLASYSWSDKSSLAQVSLADIYMNNLGDYKQAIVAYQKAISYYGDKKDAQRFQHEIAKSYANLKNYEQQRVELNAFLAKHPESDLIETVYFEIASSFYIEGKPDEAIKAFDVVLEKFPHTPLSLEAKFQRASCMAEREDLRGAIKLLKEIEGVYPNAKIIKNRINRLKKRLKLRRR